MRKLFIFSLISLLLTGCSSTVSNIKKDSDVLAGSAAKKGYFLIAVNTDQNLKSIVIDGPKDINLSHHDLASGSNYILVDFAGGRI